MKNLFLSFALASVLLLSCTSDDAATPQVGGPVPTKIVTTTNNYVQTTTFTYSGNKILEENTPDSDTKKKKYTYTGNDITKIEVFGVGQTAALVLYSGQNITYENGKIKTITEIAVAGNTADLQRDTFVYNADGTVTVTSSTVNQTTGVQSPNGRQMRYFYTNGFLTKSESISGGVVVQVNTFTNDTSKNAAFKNVLGFNEFARVGTLQLTAVFGNNTSSNRIFTYTYNTANYPTKVVLNVGGNSNAFSTDEITY